jgi:hypothetical protein
MGSVVELSILVEAIASNQAVSNLIMRLEFNKAKEKHR